MQCTLKRGREKERGSLFCYCWDCLLLHTFPLYFPSYLPRRCLVICECDKDLIHSWCLELLMQDGPYMDSVSLRHTSVSLFLKVIVQPLVPFSFLTTELRVKESRKPVFTLEENTVHLLSTYLCRV